MTDVYSKLSIPPRLASYSCSQTSYSPDFLYYVCIKDSEGAFYLNKNLEAAVFMGSYPNGDSSLGKWYETGIEAAEVCREYNRMVALANL